MSVAGALSEVRQQKDFVNQQGAASHSALGGHLEAP